MDSSMRFVKCRLSRGTFEAERFVILGASSAYVYQGRVRTENDLSNDDEVDGEVLVYVVDEGEGRDSALVELSGEPVVGGLRTWVPKTQFVEGPGRFPTNDS